MADNTALSDLELEGVTIHRPETENLSKEDTVSGERLSIWQKACFRWFQQRLLLLIQELHEVDTMRIQELFEQPRCHDPPECQGLLEISLLWVQCLKNHLASNSEEEVTLHTMLEALSKNGLVNDASTNNLIDMYHLIFIFIGWMTMLYNPNLRSRSGCFEICYTKLDSRIGIRARRRQKQVPATGVVEVSETLRLPHQSFVYLLAQLGLSLPQMNCSDHIQKPLGAARSDIFYADSILPSNIGFYSLNRVGNVKIKWSSSVCEHLDFDERSQTLVLFAYPAFCALMCSTDENAYLLDGIFRQWLASSSNEREQTVLSEEFFCEIIWTYRIIFCQDRRSWKDLRHSCRYPPTDHGSFPADIKKNPDPLFAILISGGWCRSSGFMSSLWNDLDPPPFKSVYSASNDFSYFGTKLLLLQNYMNSQNPEDLGILLHDRRDLLRFWTFWAVIGIGGISIVLAFLQMVLAIVQIVV